MTFAVLRALHTVIGDALDDIQRVYEPPNNVDLVANDLFFSTGVSPPSPPPSPCAPIDPQKPMDFPSLDTWFDPADPAEQLRTHPDVVQAINRIVAAAGQLSITVQPPFFALLDASFAYHLPSCLRIFEASHSTEILREAGPAGLHVDVLSQRNGIDRMRLAHILRLLATHHILCEREPDVFALNRVSSVCDSGKSMSDIRLWEKEGCPEMKYRGTNGVAALVGLNTDELMKASAYMTEAYLLSQDPNAPPPFNFAFDTETPYFHWLEGESSALSAFNPDSASPSKPSSAGPSPNPPPGLLGEPGSSEITRRTKRGLGRKGSAETGVGDVAPLALGLEDPRTTLVPNPNKYRLERFGVAMSGTGSWEVPGAIFNGFDWLSLPRGSVIVDVGGGIGSSSMMLAEAFCRPSAGEAILDDSGAVDKGFKFIIQDRPVVVEMGEKAWREKCPELLVPEIAQFQVHDFFTPQPIKDAAVFFLRVITHDWPDEEVRRILLHLREAALPDTKLILADFVLPLACVDDIGRGASDDNGALEGVEGAERALADPPLLANLGKASASAYWMDMTMNTIFNSRERTLREMVALTSATGWKVIKFTRAPGSLFAHMIAIPVAVPVQVGPIEFFKPDDFDAASTISAYSRSSMSLRRTVSRCGTPTFGSRMELPSPRDKSKSARSKLNGLLGRVWGISSKTPAQAPAPKPPSTPGKANKKKPSPLSPIADNLSTPKPVSSPRSLLPSSPIWRRKSHAQLQKLNTPRPSVDRPPLPIPTSPQFSQSTADLPTPSTPRGIPKAPSFLSVKQRLRSTSISSLSPSSMRSRRRPGGSSFSQFPFPEITNGTAGTSGSELLAGARLDFTNERETSRTNVAELYNPPLLRQRGLSVSMLAEAAQIETRMPPMPGSP